MKKLLLITSFLSSQLFAAQCTEKQYEPYFVINSDRYIYTSSSKVGNNVFDKKSVAYDKENQTIRVWLITQVSDNYKPAILKTLWELDIKNNRARGLSDMQLDCNGMITNSEVEEKWVYIGPNTALEAFSNSLKLYLNIKQ